MEVSQSNRDQYETDLNVSIDSQLSGFIKGNVGNTNMSQWTLALVSLIPCFQNSAGWWWYKLASQANTHSPDYVWICRLDMERVLNTGSPWLITGLKLWWASLGLLTTKFWSYDDHQPHDHMNSYWKLRNQSTLRPFAVHFTIVLSKTGISFWFSGKPAIVNHCFT